MSKYIIEPGEDANMVQVISVTQSGNAYIDSTVYVGDLEQLTADYINEHYGELQDDAYQRGFEDGKAVNDKGCEGCKYAEMGSDTTICAECCNAYHNQWTATDDEIKVGDVVYFKGDNTSDCGVVTWVCKDNVCIMWRDGSAGENPKDELLKTGRHFDIASILEAMKHD